MGIDLTKVLLTVLFILLLFILRLVLLKLINRTADKWQRLQSRTNLVKKTINFLHFFVLIVGLLGIWGFKINDLGLFISSVFAIIGVALFAQWSILSNITSGVIMFFTFPYRIGDFIKIIDGDNSIYGYIEDVRAFQVIIKTTDEKTIAFPNSMMLQKGVCILKEEHIEEYLAEKARKAEESKEK